MFNAKYIYFLDVAGGGGYLIDFNDVSNMHLP